jgi:curved DNA-binding protein CbpA
MLMPTVDPDYYALLRVDPGADAVTIRTAWAVEQRLWGVRQNAPDLATRHAAERHVQLLGEVKDVLLDPHRRATYDRERARSVASRAAPVPVPLEATPAAASPVRVANARGTGPRGYIARHGDILKPLVIGLAGALITGTQVFHWDLSSMMAVFSWLWALTDTLRG